MKIKHKETGKVIELMDGTKFAKSAYDLVDEKAAEKTVEKEPKVVKQPAAKKATAKATSKKKVSVAKTSENSSTGVTPGKVATDPKEATK